MVYREGGQPRSDKKWSGEVDRVIQKVTKSDRGEGVSLIKKTQRVGDFFSGRPLVSIEGINFII